MNMSFKTFRALSFYTLILISACGSSKTSVSRADKQSMESPVVQISTGIESLDAYLSRFETAALKHNSSDLFTFFDKDYKKDQWEILLNKNTDTFLNKFFSNNETVNDKPKMDYKNITSIVRKSVVMNVNYFLVNYLVKQGNLEVNLQITVFSRLEKGVLKYSIYGPIG